MFQLFTVHCGVRNTVGIIGIFYIVWKKHVATYFLKSCTTLFFYMNLKVTILISDFVQASDYEIFLIMKLTNYLKKYFEPKNHFYQKSFMTNFKNNNFGLISSILIKYC